MTARNPAQALEAQLAEARQREAATHEVLRVIRRSRDSPQPVFETIASAAASLCQASVANVLTFDGALVHLAATSYTEDDRVASVRRIFPRPLRADTGGSRAILTQRVVEIPDVERDGDYGVAAHALASGFKAILAVPLLSERGPIGALVVGRPQAGVFPARQHALLQTFAEEAVIAIENARLFSELQREIEAHRRSKATIAALVDDSRAGLEALVGGSPSLRRVREQIEQVAVTDSTVLILGETGTGKELVARAIHGSSARRDRPLIVVNCAALPRELVESELFGHEKGAFTGAVQQRRGRFELADSATLFLDEVGELPLEAQAKLLRVLQYGEFERLGGGRVLHTNARIVAATNRDLKSEVEAGKFRADLFYRLNVFPIALPPLRERRDDIETLARHLAERIARKLGRPAPTLGRGLLAWAQSYPWPGNIRELENVLERALITSSAAVIDLSDTALPPAPAVAAAAGEPTLEQVERDHIVAVLERRAWKIEGADGAAQALGLKASTLRGRMRQLGVRRP